MTRQPSLLDELHAIRRELLAESGGTLAGLVGRLQQEQQRSGRIVIPTQRSQPAKVGPDHSLSGGGAPVSAT